LRYESWGWRVENGKGLFSLWVVAVRRNGALGNGKDKTVQKPVKQRTTAFSQRHDDNNQARKKSPEVYRGKGKEAENET
jgi:hypothetical protein